MLDADVGLVVSEGFEQRANAFRFVLTVGVEGDRRAVTLAQGVAQGRFASRPRCRAEW